MTASAEVNRARLVYSDLGDGMPLLCLHGGMGVDRQSLHVPGILDLAHHGIRLIIPDQRGHGQSSQGSEAEYTHETWAMDARELARHLGLSQFALLGHSYGGFVALEYARRWPETLTHLLLVATSAGPVRAQAPSLGTDSELREHFRGLWPMFFKGQDKHWDLFGAIKFSVGPYNAAFGRELPAYDIRDAVAGLDLPALLVVGREDPYLPHMQWLMHNLGQAALYIFEEVGHFPFIEAQDQFVTAVTSFLSGRLPAGPGGMRAAS